LLEVAFFTVITLVRAVIDLTRWDSSIAKSFLKGKTQSLMAWLVPSCVHGVIHLERKEKGVRSGLRPPRVALASRVFLRKVMYAATNAHPGRPALWKINGPKNSPHGGSLAVKMSMS